MGGTAVEGVPGKGHQRCEGHGASQVTATPHRKHWRILTLTGAEESGARQWPLITLSRWHLNFHFATEDSSLLCLPLHVSPVPLLIVRVLSSPPSPPPPPLSTASASPPPTAFWRRVGQTGRCTASTRARDPAGQQPAWRTWAHWRGKEGRSASGWAFSLLKNSTRYVSSRCSSPASLASRSYQAELFLRSSNDKDSNHSLWKQCTINSLSNSS